MPATLSGSLDTFSLADLLQWLEINGLSGRVTLVRRGIRRTVDVKEGAIVYVSSSVPEERLATHLVRQGVLPAADVYELLAENFTTGSTLTHLILEKGLLSREELAEAVEGLALRILLDLFRWSGAAFEFDPTFSTENVLKIQLSLRGQMLAIQGAKSVDDSQRIRLSLARDDDLEAPWEKELQPQTVAQTFWSILDRLPADAAAGAGSMKDRFLVFSRFSARVLEALRTPFRFLAPYPDTVELLRAALRDSAGPDHLVRIAALDPLLTLDLLYLANSIETEPGRLTATTSQAVDTLGGAALRRLVELLIDPASAPHRDRLDRIVRRAAVSTAVAASHVSATTDVDPELAYTLGLLEPLGSFDLLKLLLAEDFEPGPFRAAALRQYRPVFGGVLARKVNLPRPFAEVLGSAGEVGSQSSEAEQLIFFAKQLVPGDQIGHEWSSDDPALADRWSVIASDPQLPARIARDVAGLKDLLGI